MNNGWMRIREAAHLMGVSQSTVRRRVDGEELRGRTGKSGRQEVFLPAKLRRELEAAQAKPCSPGHMDRGKSPDEVDAIAKGKQKPSVKADRADASSKAPAKPKASDIDQTKTPAKANTQADDGDLLRRYERMAGGSLILAQQHNDAVSKQSTAAYEQLAHTRSQVRNLRKLALAGWGSCAAVLVLLLVMTVTLGMGKARAEASANVNEQHAERAERRAQTMSGLLIDAREKRDAEKPGTTQDAGPVPGRRLHGPTVAVPTE